MQKAVEKRKATLAAKKAAQVAAEQRNGVLASRAEAGPSQTVPAPGPPVENTPFTHGYHSAVSQPAEMPQPQLQTQHIPAQQQHAQQQAQSHASDFATYPFHH